LFDNAPDKPLFTLAGIPVSISLWHPLLLGMLFYGYLEQNTAFGLGVVAIASFSVLAHEMGHAVTSLLYGLQPRVLLSGFGGLTMHQPAQRPLHEFLIVAAGPSMNFVIALVFWVVSPLATGMLSALLDLGLWINIVWGCFNLMPVMPLDGGQLFHVIMRRLAKPLRADRITYWTGLILALLLVLVAIKMHAMYGTVILVFIALQNWQALRALQESPDSRTAEKHPRVRELLGQAHAAYGERQFDLAMRLCHQARAEPYVSAEEQAHIWQVLALSAAQLEAWEDALRYAERLPGSPEMAQVQSACVMALGEPERAQRFLGTTSARLLEPERVAALRDLARGVAPEA